MLLYVGMAGSTGSAIQCKPHALFQSGLLHVLRNTHIAYTYAFCKEFNSSNESRCLENGILSAWVSFIISCVEIGSPSIKRPLIGQRNEMGIATTVHMEVKHRINKRAECLMRTFFICLFFYLRATGIFPVEDDNGSDFPLNGFFWLKLQLK